MQYYAVLVHASGAWAHKQRHKELNVVANSHPVSDIFGGIPVWMNQTGRTKYGSNKRETQ